VNPALETPHPNSYCVSHTQGGYKSSPESSLSVSESSLIESLSTTKLFSSAASGVSLSYSRDTNTVVVTYPLQDQSSHTVTFHLNRPEDNGLFTELMYGEKMSTLFSSSFPTLINDDIPDSYTFTLSSLSPILEKYGRSSPQFVSSLILVDLAIGKILNQMSSLYSGRMVTEIILMGSHPSIRSPMDTRTVFAQLSRLLPNKYNNNNNNDDNNDMLKYYPNIYIDTANTDLNDICRVLSMELSPSGVDVFCPSFSEASLLATTELLSNNPMHPMATASSTNTTTIRIANYQITLWLSITLVLTLLAAIYALAFMSFKKDTLLYSTFNPNWEERKRR